MDAHGMYKKWITNCHEDESFVLLMKYSAENPDLHFAIGPPHETITLCKKVALALPIGHISPRINMTSRGLTVAQLESICYRGIYECFPSSMENTGI